MTVFVPDMRKLYIYSMFKIAKRIVIIWICTESEKKPRRRRCDCCCKQAYISEFTDIGIFVCGKDLFVISQGLFPTALFVGKEYTCTSQQCLGPVLHSVDFLMFVKCECYKIREVKCEVVFSRALTLHDLVSFGTQRKTTLRKKKNK